jgi:aspartate aminotransferase
MSILAERIASIRPSETKAMTARAAALREDGRSVIALSQGEPDFATPPAVVAAGSRAMRKGHTKYTAVPGIRPLREAIAAKYGRDNGLTYEPDQISVGCGAKQILFNALIATLDRGDEVVIPTPCWVSYPEMVRLVGGVPVNVACGEEQGFKLDAATLEAAIGPKTKWLMLNSPSNPTGAVYRAGELKAIAEVLRRHPNVWLLSDDIYEKIVYGVEAVPMPAVAPDLKARTLLVNGVSKAYAMTGWRIGYGAGPPELIKAINTIQGQTTSHACSIAQWAATEAIAGDQTAAAEFVERFHERRDYLVRRINRISGLSCRAPKGAFYLFVNCEALIGTQAPGGRLIESDTDFAMFLLEEAGVAVVPGSAFLASPYIRLSFAASESDLIEAARRIGDACGSLRRLSNRQASAA